MDFWRWEKWHWYTWTALALTGLLGVLPALTMGEPWWVVAPLYVVLFVGLALLHWTVYLIVHWTRRLIAYWRAEL